MRLILFYQCWKLAFARSPMRVSEALYWASANQRSLAEPAVIIKHSEGGIRDAQRHVYSYRKGAHKDSTIILKKTV